MRLRTLDKQFWDYFKQCPRKACLSYSYNSIFGVRPDTFKYKSVEEDKYRIFEETACKFFDELLTNKEVTYNRLKQIFYMIVSRKKFKMKINTKYSNDYKRRHAEMTEELMTYVEFKRFAQTIEAADANHLHAGLQATVNLTEYANSENIAIRNIKNKYEYKINFPFYRRTSQGVMPIHFNHSGYPYNIQDLNHELNLTKVFFEKCVEENMSKIIVYDFKSMRRYVVSDLKPDFETIRRILRIVDQHLIIPHDNFENCRHCQHFNYCKDSRKYKKDYEEILEDLRERKKKKQDSTRS